MSTRRTLLAALCAIPIVLAGCKIDTINYFPPHPAHVRVANFLIGATSVDFSANGTPSWTGVAFTASTGTQDFDNQSATTFAYRVTGASTDLAQVSLDLIGESSYTLLAYGSTTTLAPGLLYMLDYTGTPPGADSFQSRVANVADVSTNIDVYITGPTDTLDNATPQFSSVGYGGYTSYFGSTAGAARIRITATGDSAKTPIYDSGTVTLPGATYADLVVYSVGSGALVNVAMLGVGSGAPVTVFPSTLARYKFVNAAPQTAGVTSLVDGTAATSAIDYLSYTAYSTVAAGSHVITFQSSSTPGADLASLSATFAPGSDNSIFLTGYPGSNTAAPLVDTNLLASVVPVRYVNASPDAPALQIVANNTVQVGSLPRNAASGYTYLAGGSYDFLIKDAASGSVLATVSGTLLVAGQTVTVYVVGPSTGLGLLFSLDR